VPAGYLKRYHGNFNSSSPLFCFGNDEGEPNQSYFRCDAAVCAKQKMDEEVNAV